MDEKVVEKMMKIAEEFYGTETDLTQIPVGKESGEKLWRLHPNSELAKIENGEPLSWVVVVPTDSDLADQFLRGEITERELLNLTEPKDTYEALYLCSAFTIPKERGKGYALALLQEAIEKIPHIPNVKLFAWPYTPEGEGLIKKLENKIGQTIELKK